jgi:guanylate kinase
MVVAPSGAGKSTLVNALLKQEPAIKLSISYTTRAPRPGEEHGREYYFTTRRISCAPGGRRILEWAEARQLLRHLAPDDRRADRQRHRRAAGNRLARRAAGEEAISNAIGIFILPPSIAALEERLKKRGQDEPHVITRRMLAAGGEIAHAPEFEYVIINQEFAVALSELTAIVQAARCRFAQQAARNAYLFTQLGIHAS